MSTVQRHEKKCGDRKLSPMHVNNTPHTHPPNHMRGSAVNHNVLKVCYLKHYSGNHLFKE